MNKNCYLISVIQPDRVGILRDVTSVIKTYGGNLTDLRQMILGGMFSLGCVAEFDKEQCAEDLKKSIESELKSSDASVRVLECEPTKYESEEENSSQRYVAAISGPDAPGRIHLITKLFASYGINVLDWRHDLSDKNHALTIGIVTIPQDCNLLEVQAKLRDELSPFGVSTSIRHENIFRATNEVGPISSLIDR